MSTTLFLFTNNFPFGQGESFIEAEYPYLEKNFDRIFIISSNLSSPQTRKTGTNTIAIRLPYQLTAMEKLMSMFGILDRRFWREISVIRHQYKLKISQGIISTILSSLHKMRMMPRYINKIKQEHHITGNTCYYSYWANDRALAISSLDDGKRVCRCHAGDVYFERSSVNYLPLRHHLYKNLDQEHFISSHAYSYTESVIGMLISNSKVSRLGVSTLAKFQLDIPRIEAKFVMVSCAHIKPIKRVDLIIKALATIEDIDIEWIHFGGGGLLTEMESLAKEQLTDKPNITYRFHGNISNTELNEYYSSQPINLFINVSESEGVPVSIMEAFASAIPVVATDVGATSELVDESSGVLLKPDCTIESVAEAIAQMASLSEADWHSYAENAYLTWKDKYNAAKNYPAFIEDITA